MTTAQTAHLKSKFLAAFSELGNVKAACKKAGVKRRKTVYDWRETDSEFAAAWAEAEIEATETLEAEAWRRAVKGVRSTKNIYWNGAVVGQQVETEYSDTLLIFLMKARAPDKYRERSSVDVNAKVEDVSGLTDEDRAERIAHILDGIRAGAPGFAEPAGADLGTAAGAAD